jgi:hypothetical protein
MRLRHVLIGQARAQVDVGAGAGARLHVARGDVHDPVGVDLERHLDGDLAARGHAEAGELELAEHRVLFLLVGLALEDADLHLLLVVRGGGEAARPVDRDGRVPVDDPLRVATHRAERRAMGVTSSRNVDCCVSSSACAWIAAPMATTSSGSTSVSGCFWK